MKIMKRLAVIILCITSLLSLFGCKNKDRLIVDGPGMVNPFVWHSFSVTRTDSYAQHNFHITVGYYDEDSYIVKGTLMDEDGTEYEDYQGIILPESACQKIDALQPQYLPDIYDYVLENAEEPMPLDAPEILIEVAYADGRLLSKMDENDFSIKVYEIVLPYFKEKSENIQ